MWTGRFEQAHKFPHKRMCVLRHMRGDTLAYVHTDTHTCICTYTHTHICMHTYTHTHRHTHTLTHHTHVKIIRICHMPEHCIYKDAVNETNWSSYCIKISTGREDWVQIHQSCFIQRYAACTRFSVWLMHATGMVWLCYSLIFLNWSNIPV